MGRFLNYMRDNMGTIPLPRWLMWGLAIYTAWIVGLYSAKFGRNAISHSHEHWGQVGDYFGGLLNPMFAFVSFIAVASTLKMQNRQLLLQNQQFDEIKKLNNEQRFEATLFEMINLHQKVVDSMDVVFRGTELRGRDCFKVFTTEVADRINPRLSKGSRLTPELMAECYGEWYSGSVKRHELGHYFRGLYHVFKYIYSSDLIDDRKRSQYAKIARSQISVFESLFLFYNGIYSRGENFKFYIIEYSLLQDLEPTDTVIRGMTKEFMASVYTERAFLDASHE